MRREGCGDGNFHDNQDATGKAPELLDSGRLMKSLRRLGARTSLDPGRAQVYARHAAAWQDKGDARHAVAGYDAAISLDPGNAAYYRMRGRLRKMQADFDGATADFDAAIAFSSALALEPGDALLSMDSTRLQRGAMRRRRVRSTSATPFSAIPTQRA